MKKTILFFVVIFMATFMKAQNIGLNYKAILTDSGEALADTSISVKVTIKSNNSLLWQEEHANITTDSNGIFAISIGEGTRLDGEDSFAKVNWGTFDLTLTVEVDTGNGYQTLVNEEPFKAGAYSEVAFDVKNTKMGTDHLDGSLRFYNSVFGNQYIKKGTDGIEMGEWSGLIGTPDLPYLTVDDDALWIKGKLKTTLSGDTDMKAYIYGRIDAAGNLRTSSSSRGFTSLKIAPGKYKITFNDTSISEDDYIVLATSNANSDPENLTYELDDGLFYIYSWDLSGNPKNTAFSFVVFKK